MIGNTIPKELLDEMQTQDGQSLASLTFDSTVLLIFLRHFGCTFCRQALRDLSEIEEEIAKEGVRLVFVHLASEPVSLPYFRKNNLDHLPRISDPEAVYYRRFGLVKGSFRQLLGLQVWINGFKSAVMDNNSMGLAIGDGFQMPGIFIIEGDQIRESYVHKYASDRPDYLRLLSCCTSDPVKA